jgi:hypothetical protein
MTTKMSREEREAFLADLHVGVISMSEKGRGPLTVPIWYAYEPGGEVVIATERNSRKMKLLEKGRRVSLCAQCETPPYKYVSIEGPVVDIDPSGTWNATSARWRAATWARKAATSTSKRPSMIGSRTTWCAFASDRNAG